MFYVLHKTRRMGMSNFIIQTYFRNVAHIQQLYPNIKRKLSTRFANVSDLQDTFMPLQKRHYNRDIETKLLKYMLNYF